MKKINVKILILTILIGFGIFSISFKTLDDTRLEKIITAIKKFNSTTPQTKVYIQTDKVSYSVDEDIWFKAYLVNVIDNKPDTASKILYVELISPNKSVFQTRLLKLKNGIIHGDFILTDTLHEGFYQIRGYTSWMLNFDADYLFTKDVFISNPYEKFLRKNYKEAKKFNKKIQKEANNIDLQFFPEGGNLINGIQSRVAFKITNQLGKAIEADCELIEKGKGTVDRFKTTHLGMGLFEITPAYINKYKVTAKFPNGYEESFDLPDILPAGMTLKVDALNENTIQLEIKSNLPNTGDNFQNEVIVSGIVRNSIYYLNKSELKNGIRTVEIPKDKFPGGIIVFTLFNSKGEPQSERLIFNHPSDFMKIDLKTDKEEYLNGDNIQINLTATDAQGNPLISNICLAVNSENELSKPLETNIYNYLFLSSDLKGKIENPGYYFKDRSPETMKNLDLVMLTNGWRRFDWQQVLSEKYAKLTYEVEKGINLSGKITKYFFEIPSPRSNVKLTILNQYNDSWAQVTDKKGRFLFKNIDYNDTIEVLMEAMSAFGRKNIMILVDENNPPVLKTIEKRVVTDEKLALMKKSHRFENVPRKYEKEDDGRHRIYHDADNVIKFDGSQVTYQSPLEAIRGKVPGVQIMGSGMNTKAQIRGITSIMLSNDPLYLLDGMPVDVSTINSVSCSDVEKVEILKNPGELGIFGDRGANGVIAVYTKRGFFMKRGEIKFKMLGYYTPRVYYQPKFLFDNSRADDAKGTTIYWNPQIITDANGVAKIKFKYPSNSRKLKAVFEGISTKGDIGRNEILF